MVKVLVLGHTGMLGNCVYKYFSSFENIETFTVDGRWPDDDFLTEIVNSKKMVLSTDSNLIDFQGIGNVKMVVRISRDEPGNQDDTRP